MNEQTQCTHPKCQTTNGCVGACSKTQPPKREWVGLTKMELIKLGVFPFGMSYELYEAIEAKLKEKNT